MTLRNQRLALKLTQADAANALGIHQTLIAKIERGIVQSETARKYEEWLRTEARRWSH